MDWDRIAAFGLLLLAALFIFTGLHYMDRLLHRWLASGKNKRNG